MAACDDAARQLADRSRTFDALIDFYVGSLREVDRLQRELEQAAADASLTPAFAGDDSPLHEILTRARRAYRRLIDKLQPLLIKHVETDRLAAAGAPGQRRCL